MPSIIVPKIIEPVSNEKPLIFLAGPIRGGGDWQTLMAEELISGCSEVQIAVPSRWTAEHSLASYFVRPFSQALNRQLHWERHYMELAALNEEQRGCVLFWLGQESLANPHPGPEPYAMDTRREIGKFTAFRQLLRARMVVGGSSTFHGLSVIRDELDVANGKVFPFYESMREVAAAALQEAI